MVGVTLFTPLRSTNRSVGVRRPSGTIRLSVRATAEPEVRTAEKPKQTYERPLTAKDKAEIYIGFDKSGKREGKGRVIKDDPKKYPSKEDVGPIAGAVGGWAGGEVGLWELRDEVKASGAELKNAEGGLDLSGIAAFLGDNGKGPGNFTATVNGKQVKGAVRGDGRDIIYIGKEQFIKDNKRKYPDKEDIGIITGAVGGFAGGEQGLRQFVEKGILASGAASVANLSDTQELLLKAALVTGGGVGLVVGTKTAINSAAKMLSALLQSGLVYAVFFAGLALALKAVLEV